MIGRIVALGTLALLGISFAVLIATSGSLRGVFAGVLAVALLVFVALILLGRRRPSAETLAKLYRQRPGATQSGSAADLLASGQRVRGVLKAFADTGTTARSKGTTPSRPQFLDDPIYVLDLDLYLGGDPPVDGRTIGRVPRARAHGLDVGMELPCVVNPLDPGRYFVVDWGDWVAADAVNSGAGPAAGARLIALSPAELAAELMPAIAEPGDRRGSTDHQLLARMARENDINPGVKSKNRDLLRSRVLEALQLLEHAGLVYVSDISEYGTRHWKVTQSGLAALTTGNSRQLVERATRGVPSTAERLRELEVLRASGAISDAEYTAKRAQVIGEL